MEVLNRRYGDTRARLRAAFERSIIVNDCLLYPGEDGKYTTIRNEHGKPETLHRISYRFNKGDIPKDKIVRHTCDHTRCWRPSHLILGTHLSNAQDKMERGRDIVCIGENHKLSKLTDDQVDEIRRLAPTMMRKDLAAKFGVSYDTMYTIVTYKTRRKRAND